MRIAIIGGGIAGLAAAYDLQKSETCHVTLYEQSAVLGGKIQTAHSGPYIIEMGPDSIFSAKPWAVQLMCELGMESELVEPLESEFSILSKGRLHTVPRALASLIPSASGALEKAGFLSAAAKRRALKEHSVSSGHESDESIASFFRRRFGKTFSELVAEPLLAGTHAGDAEKLSMAALYPSYLGMEREHGSVSKASAARTGAGHKGGFLTLKAGMSTLPARLCEALTKVDVVTSSQIREIETEGAKWIIRTSLGTHEFDHLILAVPAYSASKLLSRCLPAVSKELEQIRFVSSAIVTLAYSRSAFKSPLHGNGFLVPAKEHSPITGCTWSSNKWAGRSPADEILLRVFMGRDGGLNVDRFDDSTLITNATETLSRLLNPSQAPKFSRIDRWTNGMAQYELGHLERIASIQSNISGRRLSLVGASYRGNSIPDCIRQGREAASQILQQSETLVC